MLEESWYDKTCCEANARDDKRQQNVAEFKYPDVPNRGAAVIVQRLEVKTTKRAQPRFHGKQTNTKQHSHDRGTICDMRSSVPQVKRRLLINKDS